MDWLTLLTHGSPVAITAFLAWLYTRERAERLAAQALVLSLTKEIITGTAQMVQVTADNTRATSALGEHVRGLGAEIGRLLDNRGRRS